MAAVVGMAVGEGDVCRKLLQEEDGGAGTMGKGGEGTDKMQGGGGRKIEGEEGQDGSPMLGVIREELAPGGGRRQYRNCSSSYVDSKGSSMDKELADCQRAAERDGRDQDNAKERGG